LPCNNANKTIKNLLTMNKFLSLASAVVLAVALTGCNSNKLLSRTSATVADPASAEEVTPVQYKAAAQEAPAPVVLPGDRQEKVTVVDNSENSLLKDYNVVVGTFGSKANADNMKATMASRGYSAFLVQNASGMYRVVAGSFDTREAATSVRDIIRNTYPTEKGTCAEAWLLIPER